MPRFFLPPEMITPPLLQLQGDAAAHAKVLRLRAGEAVTVCDGQGLVYACTVQSTDDHVYTLQVLDSAPVQSEAPCRVQLYMAYAKGDKLEYVIQKATELGAAEIIAFPSSRCVSTPDAKSLQKKLPRWEKIALAAAEQSGRGIVPRIQCLHSFSDAMQQAAAAELSVLFYENEHATTFHQAIERQPFSTAALVTGPEGGFAPEEVTQAQESGLTICTLGSRILRCETAPLCALSALMYACGEF